MSNKDNWENPEFDIPEDAVSPGSVLPRPARAELRPPEVRTADLSRPGGDITEPNSVDVRPPEKEPPQEVREGAVSQPQPVTAPTKEAIPEITPDRPMVVPANSKPSFGKRILGICLSAAVGAAALFAYQNWGPKPEVEDLTACLDRTVPDLDPADDQRLRVILAPLFNDLENAQQDLVQSALSTFQGADAKLMHVQLSDCAPSGSPDGILELASIIRESSFELSRRTDADVLIWGEVLPEDQRVELRMNYPTDSGRTQFTGEQMSLNTNFGEDQAKVLAAKIWTVSGRTQELDTDLVLAGMTNTKEMLQPISQKPQPDLSLRQLGHLFHVLGDVELSLSRIDEESSSIKSAIGHYSSAADLFDRYSFPDEWARTQKDLGIALTSLGTKDNQTNEIKLAAATLSDAIIETPRSRNSFMWGQLQAHLAEALNALGVREGNKQMLADSISAYRSALSVHSRENYPVQWATSQHNLGAALQALGQRDNNPAIMQDSISAYQASLEVRTAQDWPKDHAITQINLGSALMTVGGRNENSEQVKEAATAFRSAIEQLDKESSAIEWATAQHSLGNALALVSEQENSTDTLDGALEAFSLALENFDRETDPTRWAVTQNNIGNVLHTLGDRRKDPVALGAAIAAYEAAVSVLSETAPTYAERVVESLSRAQVLEQQIGQTN